MLLTLLILLYRSRNISTSGDIPALLYSTGVEHVWVEAQKGGVSQIYDVRKKKCVEQMTVWLDANRIHASLLCDKSFQSGQLVKLSQQSDPDAEMLKFGWMRAGKRMALGIALHPDRMNSLDWADLPGIGPVLAERIIADRHKNGEFGSLTHVQRVDGIGEKKIAALKKWF